MAELKLELTVPFSTESEAQIVRNSLSVDPEPKRGGAKKQLTVKDNVLYVSFPGKESGPLDQPQLFVETIEAFGPPLEES
ncbi:hypothetical protein pdam_00019649 [Pocillopora damicornis]|uniref:Uncharacterized protein n=1 Tax=Pocillopora damicornis TaxID=46731 RepID=A0A3M6T5P7_POCDA|nr:hypothetical protein pdam_00019649 [Pocillopora damicornis]